jgi:NRAMP (natural resistance-associated macrophage protein)-like metal ion transporter
MGKIRNFWRTMGPGLVVGAADDDVSGITIYALAGAKFGLTMLWTALATLPFMIVIQRMCGRIGLISGRGLAANMRRFYPRWLLGIVIISILVANIVNIGADISGMAAAIELIAPVPPMITSALFSFIIIVLLIFLSYRQIAHYLKWVALVMLSYVVAAFLINEPWQEIFANLLIPHWSNNREYLMMLIAIAGTTISPYLFFWQAAEEVEEREVTKEGGDAMIPTVRPGKNVAKYVIRNEIGSMYKDVYFGMIFSNILTFFIIILASATLNAHGFTNVTSINEIASILRPLAGPYANLLFLIGIVASGVLAIPVLAGSAAYALAEAFNWKHGFEKNFGKAKQFYIVIIIATLLGLLIPVLHLDAINILYYTGIIFGAVSPILIGVVIHMANNPKVMGVYTSRWWSSLIAYILLIIMTACIVAIIFL